MPACICGPKFDVRMRKSDPKCWMRWHAGQKGRLDRPVAECQRFGAVSAEMLSFQVNDPKQCKLS